MKIKSEDWPLEWTDSMSDDLLANVMDAFRDEVLAYALIHGREKTLADYPNTDDVEAIFQRQDESQTAGLN